MDRLERFESLNEALITALTGWQSDMWTAIPGIVQSFDAAAQTCTVQPALKLRQTSATGVRSFVQMPLLLDCPVHFPKGGGYTLTFPVTKGDECLVVFSTRCIDSWWQSGGIQNATTIRMHDLSDGFAFVGFSSKPSVVSGISTDSVQLRDNAGTTFVEIKSGAVNVTATGNVSVIAGGSLLASAATSASITAPNIVLNGNVTIAGTLSQTGGGASTFSGDLTTATGNVTAQGTSLHTHLHSGVTAGGGNTGGPV
jgi:phage baseplate assembly protein gpV